MPAFFYRQHAHQGLDLFASNTATCGAAQSSPIRGHCQEIILPQTKKRIFAGLNTDMPDTLFQPPICTRFFFIRLHIISDLLHSPIGIGGSYEPLCLKKTQKNVGSMPCLNVCHNTCGYKPPLCKAHGMGRPGQSSVHTLAIIFVKAG